MSATSWLAGIACAVSISSPVVAQAPKPPAAPPVPANVVTTAAVQPWQHRQEWFCSNTPTVGQDATARIREQISALGGEGWEFVAFSPTMNVTQQGECFFAMFKRPAPR